MDPISIAIALGTAYASWRVAKKNREFQAEQNARDFEQTKELMKTTRDQALDDRNYENTYNDPKQVMERYRQAGLNPNLIYGKGAEMAAASTRPTAVPNINREAPVLDVNPAQLVNQMGTAVSEIYNIRSIQAKTDNVIADTQLKQKESLLKDADLAGKMTANARSKFDLEQAQELKHDVLENARLSNEAMKINIQKGIVDIEQTRVNIDKIKADTLYTIDENARKEQMQGYSIVESIKRSAKLTMEIAGLEITNATSKIEQDIAKEKLLQAKKTLEIMGHDATIKKAEAALAAKGIFKGDKAYTRFFLEWLQTESDHSQGGAIKNPDGTYDRTKGWKPEGKSWMDKKWYEH